VERREEEGRREDFAGTLIAYSTVCGGIVALRYREKEKGKESEEEESSVGMWEEGGSREIGRRRSLVCGGGKEDRGRLGRRPLLQHRLPLPDDLCWDPHRLLHCLWWDSSAEVGRRKGRRVKRRCQVKGCGRREDEGGRRERKRFRSHTLRQRCLLPPLLQRHRPPSP
jgi:hypothetical protein